MQKLTKYIIIFSIIFTVLQFIDLSLTVEALKDTRLKEVNPLYGHPLFLIGKFGMILIIAPVLYLAGKKNIRIAYTGMILDIGMYLLIVSNNITQLYLSRII